MGAIFIPLPPGYRAFWYDGGSGAYAEPVVGVWQEDDGLLPSLVMMARDGEMTATEADCLPLVVLAPGEELKLGEVQEAHEWRQQITRARAERQAAANAGR